MTRRVFLSGMIDGLPLDECSSWRQRATAALAGAGFTTYDPTCVMAPTTATNNKAINNTITNTELTNNSGNGATGYQAGIYDSGNNDKLINNDISGVGYDPSKCFPLTVPRETCAVDSSFGLVVKNHANRFGP